MNPHFCVVVGGCGGSGSIRDVLKIYHKRITCSCLKDKHSLARKTTPKMGACYNCGQMKERALLMVCSKCRIAHSQGSVKLQHGLCTGGIVLFVSKLINAGGNMACETNNIRNPR